MPFNGGCGYSHEHVEDGCMGISVVNLVLFTLTGYWKPILDIDWLIGKVVC